MTRARVNDEGGVRKNLLEYYNNYVPNIYDTRARKERITKVKGRILKTRKLFLRVLRFLRDIFEAPRR